MFSDTFSNARSADIKRIGANVVNLNINDINQRDGDTIVNWIHLAKRIPQD
jgi:hypothetical protein